MKYTNKIIDMIGDIPIKIFIESIKTSCYYLNPKLSLIFVIKGEVLIKQEDKEYKLTEEDVILINPNIMYSIDSSSTNQIYILEIDCKYFGNLYNNFTDLRFELNSLNINEANIEEYKNIKSVMIKLLEVCINKENGYLLIAKQLIMELIVLLINKFTVDEIESTLSINHDNERVNSIIKFVLTHYKEKISLQDISQYMHLNSQYISRYFSKQMGIPLNAFISNLRLEESIKDLILSDKKITFIALENGFPNLKSYFKAFKEIYGMTPSKYRNIYLNEIRESSLELDFSKFKLEKIPNYENDKLRLLPEKKQSYVIDLNSSVEVFDKSWKRILAFGRAVEGMREELRNQLRLVQKDIGFEYVRFHGILSDEMRVYSEDDQGNSEYNFTYVDELIDFLLEIKLKPFIELGYMPDQLAAEKKYIFAWKANISFPKSMRRWNKFIRSFVKHLIERYGTNEVEKWYFQICDQWNYFNTEDQNYFEFFKETYGSVKQVEAKLRVGGTFDLQLLDKYVCYLKDEKVALDFIAVRTYSLVPNGKSDSLELINRFGKVSDNELILQNSIDYCSYADESFISEQIDKFIDIIDKHKLDIKEFFVTEWNTTPSQKDLLHDTCFKASFFVKNIVDNFNKVNGIAYWSFSDIFEETKASNNIFHGGLGFITNNGIKKPIYYAYQFMNRLGNNILRKESDFIATKNTNNSIQILAFNYCHFIDDRKQCHSKDITLKDRYHVFNEKSKNISFILKGLSGEVVVKMYRINKENGSAYDEWLRIGAPKFMDLDELNYIKNRSIFEYRMKNSDINGDFIINEKLEPHEVMLIEIVPIKHNH
ncbi:helix-turn-helix domain-containing protein [Clostridium sp. YIM B02505]|uniref:Helix-turn-helix domain-containing protein n=1 Tax=Clostridium yunnanense TaxID=2800325 RepID=A0ABS1EKA6_9CLOT|nr:helix-turn-helix domain-containing protein [Clostridium yunnanense]MBK1809790.1 helix-turn-helix domain-containing protein [Clostridium yunnanense]